jgi:hypothetical protein
MIVLNEDEVAAIAATQRRVGIFFNLQVPESGPPLNLWFGVGDVVAGVYDSFSDLDVPTVFYGRGQFADVPALQQLINGAADRVVISLSGVSDDVLRLVGSHKHQVPGARLRIGIALFDSYWQILGTVKWIFTGITDYASQAIVSTEEGTFQNMVSISVGTRWTARRRPQASYMTDADQQHRSPGDEFLKRTIIYTNEHKKTWPRY